MNDIMLNGNIHLSIQEKKQRVEQGNQPAPGTRMRPRVVVRTRDLLVAVIQNERLLADLAVINAPTNDHTHNVHLMKELKVLNNKYVTHNRYSFFIHFYTLYRAANHS